MGAKQIVFRVCDIHDDNKTHATETVKLSHNGHRYELDVCDEHSAELYGAFHSWADFGRKTGEPTVFDKPMRVAGPIVRSPEPETTTPVEAAATKIIEVPQCVQLPLGTDRWIITTHAWERMELRKFSREDVLLAAERPEMVQPADPRSQYAKDKPHIREHKRGRCLAVVDPDDCVILTVKIAAQGTYDKEPASAARAQ